MNKIKKFIPKKIRSLIKRILQKFKSLQYIVLYNFYKKICKLDEKKILFLSDSRETLSGNFYYIYNELKNYDYELNCFFKKNLTTKKTFSEKKKLCKLIASSKFVLVDDFYPIIYSLKLRKNQELIQVWHAMGAFKTVGYSRMGKPGGPTEKSLTHKNYTAAITSSESIRKNYAEAFDIDISKIHSVGIPRTDIFFDKKYIKNKKEELYSKYPMLKDKKVVLFAPTFRGNGQKSAYYDFSVIDFKKIKKELKEDYVFIIKLHPFIKNIEEVPKNDKFFLDLTHEREINDLLFITDVLITDYSSVIFENSLLNNKTIFFVPDLEEYISSRDFYYSFDKYTYGDVVYNTDELINSIKKSKTDKEKLKEFKEYFCSSCDGNSTKRFVEELIIKR